MDGNSININGNVNLQSLQALADWHPWAGSSRLSSGLIYNNNKLDGAVQPSEGVVNIGGVDYPAAGTSVHAKVDFKKIAHYLGIGWGRTPKNTGFSFTSDIGIMFQGAPNANITTTGIPGSAALTADTAKAKPI